MSSVEKLEMYGIRSFGPDEEEKAVIHFSSPLTLILGQNGCGKTTIIEALKYAICGDLPAGTDSGSGFVHDPKLAHVHEVKGNVKLQCRNVKGEKVTVSRVVRVQQKARKLEFKSMDSTFTRYIGDEKQTVSGKCADIDGTMCEALGTSEAVLTNVILCHQEDSLWPLEKGKKIKERFDAIFGITEYNKCVDYFRGTTKDFTQQKALMKKDVEYQHKHWEETKEKQRQLEDFKGKEAACQDEIRKMEAEMEPINAQIREMIFKEEHYSQHKAEMKGKEDRQKLIVETIDELKKEIRDEFLGDKSDLLNEIRNFEEKLKETEVKLMDLNDERAKLLSEEARIQKDINGKSMLMGQLQRDEDENRKNIDTRNKCLRNLGSELEINVVSSSQLTASSSEDALRDIENRIKTRHAQMKELREEQSQFENQIQSKIDTLREKKSTLNHEVKTKQTTIENNEREIKKVIAEIAEVDKSGDKLAGLEKNLKEVNEQLAKVIDSLDANACKADIEKANEDLKMLDGKVASVENEIKQLHKINLERANLNKLMDRHQTLEDELNTLENKHRETLQHLLTSIPENDIKPKLETRMKELKEEISANNNAVKELERKLCVLIEKKRNVEDQMKQKKKKMSQDQDKISEHLGDAEDIQTYHQSIIDKLNQENDKKGTGNASIHMYKKYVAKLRSEESTCPLCYRDFSNREECEELIADLEKKITLIPQQLKPLDQHIKTLQEEQTKVAGLLPLDEDIRKIREIELPKLKTDLQGKEKEIKSLEEELKSLQEKLIAPQMDLEMSSKVLPDVVLIDERRKEIQKLKRDIENQQANVPSNASEKTLEQAIEEQDKLRLDIKNLREKLKNDQANLSSYNDRVNKLREKKTDLTAQQLKIVGGVQKRKNLTEKLEELNLMQATLQKELELARTQLEPINEELDQTNRTLIEMKTKHQLRLEDRRREITDFEMKVNEIKSLQIKIARYTKDGAGRRLEETKRELEEKRERKDKLELRKNKIEKELEEHKKFQNTHELQKRDLDLNLKLRHKNEELVKVREEIQVLEGQVKVLNYDQLLRERRQKEKKKTELEAKKHHIEGKLANIRSNIRDKIVELNKPENKNAEDEYRKHMVKLAVVSKSIEDLKLYEKAMAWAMLIFHQERMKMINEIIRDLWRHIYKGNDIDYIEVKTDESTSGGENKRTYNYKVIQVKNGVEIDMPGRCSAGQKVLACLIIRLALAETFCKHCGILALDEPTTNLDRENIDSLSEALAELVERRNTHRNFQLLVITHDEDFLRKLFRVQGVNTYLNVKRDGRGRSQVIRRDVM